MPTNLLNNAVYWVDVEKIFPNPFQPRKEFDETSLAELADSIRQYGIMQPLVVTKVDSTDEHGNPNVHYELIAGERRLRASKIAGIRQVPALIRVGDDDRTKLEIAIIENLQREDLNAVDRAKAFLKLQEDFGLTHSQIAKKMGKSREYVSNSLRLLHLPEHILDAVQSRKLSEGHTRPLLMLSERPAEQDALFKEIMYRKISVRESERIARRIAHDRVRKEHHRVDPKILDAEKKLSESLGTRVQIEAGEKGGKIVIDYFKPEELDELLRIINTSAVSGGQMSSFSSLHAQPMPFASTAGIHTPTAGDVHSDFTPVNVGSLAQIEMPSVLDSLGNLETIEHRRDLTEVGADDADDVAFSNSSDLSPDNYNEPSSIDDVELDIVADPKRDVPDAYASIFNF